MHKKGSDGRTWRPQHGRSPSPPAPPAVLCSSPSLGINAAESNRNRNRPDRTNWPAERSEPTAFYENAHTPGSSFSPEPEPTPSPIQTVAAVAERVVTPPAPAAACDHPFPQSSRLRRPHLRPSRPVPSPLPRRGPRAELLPREGRRPPGRRGGGYEAGNFGAGCPTSPQ